ncbi:MAG: Dihydrolipoyllysine-residue acetyltransferase component of pyruvate dehydrogenase complex [Chlamydiia bacterium]|nr:Dihydrolipoyllysine-residue acetyltransferase component of pyruvate dehydrogenase complex [Chlamydiia bacterium]
MEEFRVDLPKLGESITSATVVEWLKGEGEQVEKDEPLLDVSTDKVNSEIPSPVSGKISKIVAHVDEVIEVGEPLCLIATQEAGQEAATTRPLAGLSPVVLRLMKEHNISHAQIESLQGSGAGGRISKKDIQQFIEKKKAAPRYSCESAGARIGAEQFFLSSPQATTKEKSPAPPAGAQVLRMSPRRKAIAQNMMKSHTAIPSATLMQEVDVTSLVEYITVHKKEYYAKYRAKLTMTSFIAQAICQGIEKYPLLNARMGEGEMHVFDHVNLGIAVNVGQDVMVPVIKGCESLPLHEIALQIADYAHSARDNQIQVADLRDGTITLTNFGMTGIQLGFPIIRHPEIAIVGVGSIQKRPGFAEDGTVVPRSIMHLSLTFDHRAFDGIYGCKFLKQLSDSLSQPETNSCAAQVN